MGNEVGLMYERRFNMTRKEAFPSPMGNEAGLMLKTKVRYRYFITSFRPLWGMR